VTNSGGPGILATDACDAAGLDVPELSATTQTQLRAVVDANAAVSNPVDLVASATPEVYARALGIVLADDAVDAALVICTPTYAAPPPSIAEVLQQSSAATGKTVVGCFLAWPDLPPLLHDDADTTETPSVPAFASPEPAARAIARAANYEAWRKSAPGALPDLEAFDLDRARGIVESVLVEAPSGNWLSPDDVEALFAAAGVPTIATAAVGDAEEAARVGTALGYPVALKAAGPQLVHKSDVGGVRLGLRSEEEVVEAYRSMASDIGEQMTGGIVQQMAAPGLETIIGVVHHDLFGPLMMFGMGGIATELQGDRSFRILPVTDQDAADLVRSLRASPLLFGYRGSQPVAVKTLEDIIQRLARLAGAVPELTELEINPLIVSPAGAVAVDARVKVSPASSGGSHDVRRMRS
jgi:acyl-CoA synthetase (NDP forming)